MNKLEFQRAVLERVSRDLAKDDRDESAIPSYLHRNPLISWLVSRRMSCAISLLDLSGDECLLDFGCGTGMLFLQLPPRDGLYLGVDVTLSPAQKTLEQHGRDDVKLFSSEGWDGQVADNSVERIAAIEVLEHVEDVSTSVRLFRQKLKPNGRLVVSGPTENLFYRICRKIAGFSGKYHHRNIFDIERLIETVGFVQEKRVHLPLPGPFGLFVILSYRNP